MPTSVRLDARAESLVNRLAKKTGRTKSQVIRDAIARLAEAEEGPKHARTAYEAMKHLIGIADSGGMNLSERTGEKFRALLLERQRARERAHRPR